MSDLQHIPGTPSSNDEQHAQPEAMQARQPLPLAVLGRERQARWWSVEYVASHLKLAIRQINVLAEDCYHALPSPVVIRIYAKMLGIDPGALVAALPAASQPAEVQIMSSRTLSTLFSESSLPLRGQHELPLARIVWIAAGIIVIACLFAAMKYGNWEEIKNSLLVQCLHVGGAAAKQETTAAPNADSSDSAAKPAVVADNDSAVPSEVVAPTASAPYVAAAPAAAAPHSAAAAGAPPNATMTPAPPAPQTAANLPNPLQLTISQDSWIEIRLADKSIVVSRIMKAGTTEAFNVDGTMSIIVGNAAGVEASLRGKPLPLGPTTSSNVARLDLK